VKWTARVNPGLCMGCGTCVAICPSKCVDLKGFAALLVLAYASGSDYHSFARKFSGIGTISTATPD